MDRRISEENKWLREGLSARRKRNQGRLRELENTRRSFQTRQRGSTWDTDRNWLRWDGGQLVLEAKELNAIVPTDNTSNMNSRELASNRRLINRLNLLIRRGDRIGIIGPNGIGKSTLVRILLKLEQADKGRVKHGFGFKPAYFDQKRESLDRDKSPWLILTGGGSDTIEIDGKPVAVVRYLRDFLLMKLK